MLRDPTIKSGDVMGEFCDSISEVLDIWGHKMKELKGMKESERTKTYWTIKIIKSYFYKHGGLSI